MQYFNGERNEAVNNFLLKRGDDVRFSKSKECRKGKSSTPIYQISDLDEPLSVRK